jgi:hypothetical protein
LPQSAKRFEISLSKTLSASLLSASKIEAETTISSGVVIPSAIGFQPDAKKRLKSGDRVLGNLRECL